MQDGPSQHDERKTPKGRWRPLTAGIITAISLVAASVWNGAVNGGVGVARGFLWEAGKVLLNKISNAADSIFHSNGGGEAADKPAVPPRTGQDTAQARGGPGEERNSSGSSVKAVVDEPQDIPTMKGR